MPVAPPTSTNVKHDLEVLSLQRQFTSRVPHGLNIKPRMFISLFREGMPTEVLLNCSVDTITLFTMNAWDLHKLLCSQRRQIIKDDCPLKSTGKCYITTRAPIIRSRNSEVGAFHGLPNLGRTSTSTHFAANGVAWACVQFRFRNSVMGGDPAWLGELY